MKVFLNCPTHEVKAYCLEPYTEAVKSLTYEYVQIIIGDNSPTENYSKKIAELGLTVIRTPFFDGARDRIIAARNKLREEFLKSDCTHFFSLEQDVIPPPDTIQRLLAHRKHIISGIYLNPYQTEQGLKALPVLWKEVPSSELMQKFTKGELEEPRLIKVKAAGMGCILMSREVMEKVKFRYELDKPGFDDVFFCKDAQNLGYEIYADTSIKCKHAIKGGQWANIKK